MPFLSSFTAVCYNLLQPSRSRMCGRKRKEGRDIRQVPRFLCGHAYACNRKASTPTHSHNRDINLCEFIPVLVRATQHPTTGSTSMTNHSHLLFPYLFFIVSRLTIDLTLKTPHFVPQRSSISQKNSDEFFRNIF